MIKLIDNWYATNKNEDFWNIHDLTAIPQENLKNIYLLRNAACITSTTSNLSKAYNSYSKLIENAEELKNNFTYFFRKPFEEHCSINTRKKHCINLN